MRKLRVMFENRRSPDGLDVIGRCRQSDGTCNVGCATFKPMWRFLAWALFVRDPKDQRAAAVPGRDRIQKLRATVKHADAGRSTHLVSRERKEIAAQLLDIKRHVANALCRVDQRQRAHSASFGAKVGDWINCP